MRIPLRRRGAWLSCAQGSWMMASVVGPLPSADTERQAFEVITSTEEVLLVSRPKGERGMRDLQLDRILTPVTAKSA